jgi:hypothetical protein
VASETITYEEFETRLESANKRLRQELLDTQKRVQELEMLIRRKEARSEVGPNTN